MTVTDLRLRNLIGSTIRLAMFCMGKYWWELIYIRLRAKRNFPLKSNFPLRREWLSEVNRRTSLAFSEHSLGTGNSTIFLKVLLLLVNHLKRTKKIPDNFLYLIALEGLFLLLFRMCLFRRSYNYMQQIKVHLIKARPWVLFFFFGPRRMNDLNDSVGF